MLNFRNAAFAVVAGSLLPLASYATTVSSTSASLGTTDLESTSAQTTGDGVTVTFSGSTVGDSPMPVDNFGIELKSLGDLLNITFNSNVSVTGYGLGAGESSNTGSIEFYVDDGPSQFNSGVSTGSYSLATPIAVNAGSVFTINNNASDIVSLNALTFTVPEPVSLGLLGLAGLAMVRRRRV